MAVPAEPAGQPPIVPALPSGGPASSGLASREGARLARSAGLIGVATMSSRVLGLARDMVYARLFGAGDIMDAFNVAFRIPNLLRDLFAEGAMTAAFVPTFTRTLTNRGRGEAWQLGSHVISALIVVTGAIAALGILFAAPLTHAFASDYANVPGKLELTTTLTRVMFPFLTLVAIAVACMGMLNSLRHFFVPALSPAMFNIGCIVGAVGLLPLAPVFGFHPAMVLAVGTLLGGVLQAAIQWPPLHREGYRFRFALAPRDPDLREILVLMVPGTVGLAAVQVNLFVNTVLATSQGTGAVSWLQYAFRLMYLPIGLFGVSIATAAVPTLAGYAAKSDMAGMRATISSGLRMMLMLNVPATVGLIALAQPIVALLYERGRFAPTDTAATAAALAFYAPGLVGYSVVKIASPTFYALRDSRTPVTVSMTSVVLNIILNVTLVRVLGYRGLALGTAMAALLNAGLLLWLLRRRLGGIDGRRVSIALAKILTASAAMALVVILVSNWLTATSPAPRFMSRLGNVGVSIAAGLLTLVLAARVLRIGEFTEAIGQVTRRLRRRT